MNEKKEKKGKRKEKKRRTIKQKNHKLEILYFEYWMLLLIQIVMRSKCFKNFSVVDFTVSQFRATILKLDLQFEAPHK